MQMPQVVDRKEWSRARAELLRREKEVMRAGDELASARRRLPMVPMTVPYTFLGGAGPAGLLDLFDGRRQLVVYQFMDNGPDDYCLGCSAVVDNIGNLAHLRARDTTFVVVSDMPAGQLTAYWSRMRWTVPVYSSRGTTFGTDCGAGGGFGLSVFLRDRGVAYQTYFTRGRGVELLRPDFQLLDLTPYGRQESWEDSPKGWPQTEPYAWWRLHDEYDNGPVAACCAD